MYVYLILFLDQTLQSREVMENDTTVEESPLKTAQDRYGLVFDPDPKKRM